MSRVEDLKTKGIDGRLRHEQVREFIKTVKRELNKQARGERRSKYRDLRAIRDIHRKGMNIYYD